jgi:flagellar biogenesis protein FliO
MPFFVANIGVRELSFSVFLKKLEAAPQPAAIAFGVSGLILLINIILPAILGLIWMLKGNRSREDLSEKEYVSTIKVE